MSNELVKAFVTYNSKPVFEYDVVSAPVLICQMYATILTMVSLICLRENNDGYELVSYRGYISVQFLSK